VNGRWAVLVGEEAAGLPEEVVVAADRRVTVPMPGGTESLNVGVATGIVVYQLTRNRSRKL
jgi:tRNA G18 (ribose-2'-O)-methylase SpoU